MKKLMFVVVFIVLFGALLFADTSTSTLEIKGYKLSNMPDGILRVYVYNTTSTQDLTKADLVSNQIDVSDYLSNYISGSKDVFSIKVQTNLNKTVIIKVTVAPFTSQDSEHSSVISTTYSLSQSPGYYVTTESYPSGSSWWSTNYYYYRYNASATVSPSYINATDATSADNYSTITLKMASARRSTNRNTLVRSATGGSSYTLTGETLYPIENGATVDSTIAVKMKLNTTLNDITPNVQYVAPVVIEVSIQ